MCKHHRLIIQCQLDNTKAAKKQRIKGHGFLGEIKGRGSNIALIYIYNMVTAGYPSPNNGGNPLETSGN
jgi:hypothetical protein